MSVDKPQSGTIRRMAATRSKYHSRVYLRFINFRIRLLPLCTGKWICRHTLFFRNDTQRVIAHILRMGSGETHAHPVGLVCHQPQKFRERNSLSVGPLMEVRIHILPQKRDFLIPALFQIPHLIQDAFHIPASFPSTRVRHNTIMAKNCCSRA